MPVVMPVIAGGGGWFRAQQVIQNVNDSAYVSFRASVSVLERRVQGPAERSRVHAFSMVVHTLDNCPLPTSRIFLRGELLQFLR